MRPESIKEEYLVFLDSVREGGLTNMMSPVVRESLENIFDLSRREARKVHMYWIKSFGNDDR